MSPISCDFTPDQRSAILDAGIPARRGRTSLAPLVSVCIVNWNCRALLAQCLRSLLEQPQGLNLEVIVVDNGSTDGAADMVAADYPQVCLLRNAKNAGFARANNQAIRVAAGEFLFFLNNDTIIPPTAVAKLVSVLQRHPEAIMIGPALRDAEGRIQNSHRRRPSIATFLSRTTLLRWTGVGRAAYEAYRRNEKRKDMAVQPVEVLMGAAMMIRRDDFLALGAWDEDFTFGGEDLELCHRAAKWGHILYAPEIEIVHFGRESTRQNIGFASPNIAAGFARYFRKSGASPAALFLYKLALTLDAPLQIIAKGGQYLLRRLCGRHKDAERSLTAMRGSLAFLCKGLWKFWRA